MTTIEDRTVPTRDRVVASFRRAVWLGGWPARFVLLSLVRAYRLTLGRVIGGRCRFYPSCSAYAEAAIAQVGAARGVVLSVWRILRCSPLTRGGVDHPPVWRGHGREYDAVIHQHDHSPARRGPGRPEVAA